jgi:hypothetical protein
MEARSEPAVNASAAEIKNKAMNFAVNIVHVLRDRVSLGKHWADPNARPSSL